MVLPRAPARLGRIYGKAMYDCELTPRTSNVRNFVLVRADSSSEHGKDLRRKSCSLSAFPSQHSRSNERFDSPYKSHHTAFSGSAAEERVGRWVHVLPDSFMPMRPYMIRNMWRRLSCIAQLLSSVQGKAALLMRGA